MKKLLILIHRYVGIGVCLLMSAWCLSGFVMMYVGFPALEEQERIAGLPVLDLDACCDLDAVLATVGDKPISGFAIEMLAGRPVLKMDDDHGTVTVSLRTGEIVDGITDAEALEVAAGYMKATALSGTPKLLNRLQTDQWTVTGQYNAFRPLYRLALGDAVATELYVAGTNGEVVLDTTAKERFWNWFGAVTHWLYPSILRQHGAAWSQVVIWTSILGTFLTLTGLWLGVTQIRAGRSGKFSPYSGWNWWHHLSGLVFGVLTLTWVFSGLVSMNPFGWLEGTGSRPERDRLQGVAITSRDAVHSVRQLVSHQAGPDAPVRVASAPFNGSLFLTLQGAHSTTRVDATFAPAALQETELRRAAEQLQPAHPIKSADLMVTGDEYYYDSHDGRRRYPVYRVMIDDVERTRYYLDPLDGRLLQKADRDRRWYRWLFEALHRWDFSRSLRERPLWDLVVLPLLLGVTGLSLTGVYLGFRRVKPLRRTLKESDE